MSSSTNRRAGAEVDSMASWAAVWLLCRLDENRFSSGSCSIRFQCFASSMANTLRLFFQCFASSRSHTLLCFLRLTRGFSILIPAATFSFRSSCLTCRAEPSGTPTLAGHGVSLCCLTSLPREIKLELRSWKIPAESLCRHRTQIYGVIMDSSLEEWLRCQ